MPHRMRKKRSRPGSDLWRGNILLKRRAVHEKANGAGGAVQMLRPAGRGPGGSPCGDHGGGAFPSAGAGARRSVGGAVIGYTVSYMAAFPEQDGETGFGREPGMPYARAEGGAAVLYGKTSGACVSQRGDTEHCRKTGRGLLTASRFYMRRRKVRAL